MFQYHFTPASYDQMMADDVPAYGRLQHAIAVQTEGLTVATVLDLGTGTGATARAILALHASAAVVGIDVSRDMLDAANRLLPAQQVTLLEQRLQDPLPAGPYQLVVSALAIHHHCPQISTARTALMTSSGGWPTPGSTRGVSGRKGTWPSSRRSSRGGHPAPPRRRCHRMSPCQN